MKPARVHHASRRRGGGMAAGSPAQQPVIPVVGFLTSLGQNERPNLVDAFRRGLSEVGFVEGRNVAIEYPFRGKTS